MDLRFGFELWVFNVDVTIYLSWPMWVVVAVIVVLVGYKMFF